MRGYHPYKIYILNLYIIPTQFPLTPYFLYSLKEEYTISGFAYTHSTHPAYSEQHVSSTNSWRRCSCLLNCLNHSTEVFGMRHEKTSSNFQVSPNTARTLLVLNVKNMQPCVLIALSWLPEKPKFHHETLEVRWQRSKQLNPSHTPLQRDS